MERKIETSKHVIQCRDRQQQREALAVEDATVTRLYNSFKNHEE